MAVSRVRPLPIMETIDGLVITAVSTEDLVVVVNSDFTIIIALVANSLTAVALAALEPAVRSETEGSIAEALLVRKSFLQNGSKNRYISKTIEGLPIESPFLILT